MCDHRRLETEIQMNEDEDRRKKREVGDKMGPRQTQLGWTTGVGPHGRGLRPEGHDGIRDPP